MTTKTPAARKPRRMAREANASPAAIATAPKAPSRLDALTALLASTSGASIGEMMAATGWQAHSVRGAMAGAPKKRGLAITSEKIGGERRYRGAQA